MGVSALSVRLQFGRASKEKWYGGFPTLGTSTFSQGYLAMILECQQIK